MKLSHALSVTLFLLLGISLLCGFQQQNFNPALASLTGTNSWSGSNTFTQQITNSVATGTAPFAISSTTPVGTLVVTNHPRIQSCGTSAACSPSLLAASQIVFGSVALVSGTPSTATVTGISPAFTSNSSYKCVLDNQTSAVNNLVAVTSYASGSSFVITGPAVLTDTIGYVCVGN